MQRLKSTLQKLFVVFIVGLLAFFILDGIGPGNAIENAVALLVGIPLHILGFIILCIVLGGFLLALWLFGFFVRASFSELIRVIRRQPKIK